MITAEIKVNGALIAYMYVQNIDPGTDESCKSEYCWRYIDMAEGTVTEGILSHFQEEGADKLIALVFAAAHKKRSEY